MSTEEKDPWNRDEFGEIIHSKLTEEEKTKIHESRFIYEFREFIESHGFYAPVYEHTIDEKHVAFQDKNIIQHFLFKEESYRNRDEYFSTIEKANLWLNKYFVNVLKHHGIRDGDEITIDISSIYLLEERFRLLNDFIVEFGLHKIKDFILFLISSIQRTYLETIHYKEQPEELRRIRKFPSEIKKLVQVLEDTETDYKWDWNKDGPPPILSKVSFKFNGGKKKDYTITITDNNLVSYIPDAIKENYNNGSYKNWRKQISAFPHVYSPLEKDLQYRYSLTQNLHKFFVVENVFAITKGKTTNKEMLCIARILEFAHINILDKSTKEKKSTYIDEVGSISIVRNYLKRKQQTPKRHGPFKIAFNKNLLYKYFDKELVDDKSDSYDIQTVNDVCFICERFEIDYLFPFLVHILSFVKGVAWAEILNFSKPVVSCSSVLSYNKFIRLAETLNKSSGVISKVVLQLTDGTTQEHTGIVSNILEVSLKNYFEENRAEFVFDVKKVVDGALVLKHPSERFLLKFCDCFYNFLLNEVKLTRKDIQVTEKFHLIIGLILQRAMVWRHQMHDEDSLIKMVAEWISQAKRLKQD